MYSALIIIGVIGLAAVIATIAFAYTKKENFVENYELVKLGNSQEEVKMILGDNYTESILKDNTVKWDYKIRISGASVGKSFNGVSIRSYDSGYTMRITIKFKDGIVIEKNALNLK